MRLRTALTWTLLCLLPAADARADGDAPAPQPPTLALESEVLPNGLKVALHRDPSVPRVTVCVAYHVGSKNEKAGRTGFAHLFEHMMFRGTKNVPNYDIPLQEAGAQSNAFTSEDMTVYYETVPADFLGRALYLEAERLAFLPSALDQAKFDTEREVVKNERRQSYENRPYGLAEETILAAVYPAGHPYSWSVIGSMADLDRASLDDLRAFFAEFYQPANATLCLAGDFDPAAARALIRKYFGPLAAGPKPPAVAVPPTPARAVKVVQYDAVKLPRVYWSWPTVADAHPDAPALDVLAILLAKGDASRLLKSLVLGQRVSKDVSADSSTNESAGLFTLESTAADGADVEASLRAIEAGFAEALAGLASDPPSAAELGRVKALYEMSSYSSLTSPLRRAITLAVGFSQRDDPTEYRKDFARHLAVTTADLRRVAAKYLVADKAVLWTEPLTPEHPKSPAVQAGPSPADRDAAPASAGRTPAAGPDWSALPGPSAPVGFKAPKFVRRGLKNGLDVWAAPWSTLPLVSVQLLIPAGTADDPAGKSGLATLTATLLDKGTASQPATEFAEALEALGVSLGVRASADDMQTGFSAVSRNLRPALTALGALLASPRFDPADFDRERRLQLAGLEQGPDSVNWIARRAFPALLYGAGHPYANPADGSTATVKGLGLEDVRRFHAEHLGPKGATLIVVGAVEPESLFTDLETALGGWKPQAGGPTPRPPSATKAEPGVIHLADKPGAVQCVLSVGRRWADRSDPRYFATLVGNRILGGDFLSRLNQNLREKNGFTYGASSAFRFRRTGSVWSVSTQVRADATAPALRETLAELDALAGGKPFTAEEIGTALGGEAKSYPESFDSPSSIAGVLEELARFGLPPDYLETYLDRLQATDPAAVGRAMAEVVAPTQRVVLVVGDRKQVEPKLRALGFDKVRAVTADGAPAGDP